MKVVFNCGLYEFHRDYYENIARELLRRGHEVEFSEGTKFKDADFTIIADEAQKGLGGKVIWIGHSFDAKGAMWNNPKGFRELDKHADYAFVYSESYKDVLSEYFKKPIHITGMAKLDGLFGKHGDSVLYAPTFDEELSADLILGEYVEKIVGEIFESNNLITRRHPAHWPVGLNYKDCFTASSIVISDYSSSGMEAIVLDKPTILVNNSHRFQYKSFPPDNYICNRARNAAIRVNDEKELKEAIKIYRENPSYLSKERRKYGNLLCEYRGVATERTVDVLEELYEYRRDR